MFPNKFIVQDASKEFGVSSKEARLAWEAVEEVEQFGSELAAAVPKPLDEECDVELDEVSRATIFPSHCWARFYDSADFP